LDFSQQKNKPITTETTRTHQANPSQQTFAAQHMVIPVDVQRLPKFSASKPMPMAMLIPPKPIKMATAITVDDDTALIIVFHGVPL